MTFLRKMAETVLGLFGNRANDPEFDVEMQEHMRLLAERYMRQGMAPESPAIAARRQRIMSLRGLVAGKRV